MNISHVALAAAGFGLLGFGASANEVVTIPTSGGDIVGTLALPAGETPPVVLLLHGFTGARDELKTDHVKAGVFAHTAAALAEAGYASLRIDFRGSGESLADLTFADTTFEGQIADGLAALDYLQSLDAVDGEDIHVIGWSQGGLVAAAVAGRSNVPDTAVLWNAVADPMATYGGLLGADTIKMAAAGEPEALHTVALPWGAELDLKGAFFQGVAGFDPTAEIVAYEGPIMVVQGLDDTTVLPEAADAWLEAHNGEEMAYRGAFDHVFNTFGEGETLDQLIEATVAFLDTHDD